MRSAMLALLLLPGAAFAEDKPSVPALPQSTACQRISSIPVTGADRNPGIHPLAKEPNAAVYLPMMWTDAHGCTKPVKVRETVPTQSPLDRR